MELAMATGKRRCARGGDGGGTSAAGGSDRLSALPDCLLHVIMSSMKARQAVQTCVLSKRWRHLWRFVPGLDIDFDEFIAKTAARAFVDDGPALVSYDSSGSDDGNSDNNQDGSEDDESDGETSSSSSDGSSGSDEEDSSDNEDGISGSNSSKLNEWQVFEDFAVHLMLRCNMAMLDSFRLHITPGRAPAFGDWEAGKWLRRAMKFSTPDPPRESLGQRSSSSWHLKRLYLCNVVLDNCFAKHVSSLCPSLQDLELDDCTCEIHSITSDSLKSLVLKRCGWRKLSEITCPTLKTLVIDGGWNSYRCLLVISAPSVAYLRLNLNNVLSFHGGISVNEMPSIVKASIHLQFQRINVFKSKFRGNLLKLLRSVSDATSLELSGDWIKVLGKEPAFQEFKNLRSLLLGECDLSDHTLGFFLHSSPNLDKLTWRHCKYSNDSKENKGTSKLNEASSSECHGHDLNLEKLKIEIIYKEGDASYYQLLYLLFPLVETLLKDRLTITKVN
ncbi:hypothetical protein U9M48_001866 [Paspalum notatum var. saurae]|uniref:F-box domain-containing protein n=1 Tax=Paspalum notatum var. saurae TaxID=547442 RepID=A0AAQ3SJB9_PASNO